MCMVKHHHLSFFLIGVISYEVSSIVMHYPIFILFHSKKISVQIKVYLMCSCTSNIVTLSDGWLNLHKLIFEDSYYHSVNGGIN